MLLAAYRDIAEAVDAGAAITPAAEWLIDNFHVVEKADPRYPGRSAPWLLSAAAQARRRTVRGTTRACSAWPGRSWPIPTACSIPRSCAATCGPIKTVQPLTIGELWAVAITLRIVLVENLQADRQAGRRQPAPAAARRTL